jgi:hemolysin activation/secretion protein
LKNRQLDKPCQRTMIGLFSATLLLTLLNRPLLAQSFDSNQAPLDRPSVAPYAEKKQTPVLPELPELPPIGQDDTSLSSQGNIIVERFQFEGNTVFNDAQLAEITQHYCPKISAEDECKISAEKLQEIKNKITNHYIQAGYINSGAIIHDQKLENGIVTITIIEGKLFQVKILNEEELRLRPSYIEKRVKGEDGVALNIEKLQERLQLLQLNPLIDRLQAELGPGVELGEGVLNLKIFEDKLWEAQLRFNNYRSPSVGAYRGQLEFWHRNVTGMFGKGWGLGDTFYLRYGLTEGLSDFGVKYSLPLNSNDTTLSFQFDRSDSEVIEYPFSQLDVESEADTYAITLSHPLIKTPRQTLDFALRLEKRASKTFLLGRPFSFSPGVRDGESELSVIRFSQDWVNRSTNRVIAGRSSFNFGVDALNSTINDDGSPDSEFFSWLGQFQIVRRLDWFESERLKKSQIIFRTDAQWADQDLLPLEKLSIGGATTVRGYRENVITRDNGLISSLELRIPIWQSTILSDNPEEGWIEFATFMDYGRSWNADSDTPDPKDIYSVGIGLRWAPSKKIHANLYWGHALRDVEDPDEKDLQDDGVHFDLSILF